MARRNSTRKGSRKNRRANGNGTNMAPANGMPNDPIAIPNVPPMNNATKNNATKTRKQAGGKRKLSPALREWNKKVMEVYREMKKKNPNTRLMDAMKEAKKRS
jgi:hypothetical protein